MTGDSGGGVFEFVGGSWRLAGIMDAMTSTIANEPIGNVVSGNDQSLIADLSQYRDQIEAVLNGPERLWQNQVNHFDVDHSGSVSARDVLLLINRLQANGTMTLSGTPSATDPLLDVNGDGLVSTLDLIQEINFLAGVTATPSLATSSSLSLVPEPSTAVLALLGILWIAIARRAASAKRKC